MLVRVVRLWVSGRRLGCSCPANHLNTGADDACRFIGPHAPHLPSTPPPYAVDPALALIPVPVDPIWNVTAADKHAFLAVEPVIDGADLKDIQTEHTHRLQALAAVDVIVEVSAAAASAIALQ
jgi:hypothetical protein